MIRHVISPHQKDYDLLRLAKTVVALLTLEEQSSAGAEKSSESSQLILTLDTTVKLDAAHMLLLQKRLNSLTPNLDSELSAHVKTHVLLYKNTHTHMFAQSAVLSKLLADSLGIDFFPMDLDIENKAKAGQDAVGFITGSGSRMLIFLSQLRKTSSCLLRNKNCAFWIYLKTRPR